MPGRYRFPRPSRRLRQTRLEPRERQQKLQSHDLPVNSDPAAHIPLGDFTFLPELFQ